MLKEQRVHIICEELAKNGFISNDMLTEKYGISRSTVRRDICELEKSNLLKRVHGGAVAISPTTSYEPPFVVRQDLFLEEKRRIAVAAHNLINVNETLLLDSGTTVHALSKTLGDIPQLYVATNDLKTATELTHFTNVDLMVLGGSLRRSHFSLHGYFTDSMISQIHADKCFIGVDAVDFNIGFMNFSTDEIQTKRLMIQASNQVIVLCDHSKFDKIAFANICQISDVDIVITGSEISEKNANAILEAGVQLIKV